MQRVGAVAGRVQILPGVNNVKLTPAELNKVKTKFSSLFYCMVHKIHFHFTNIFG